MAKTTQKQTNAPILTALLGKTVFFNGKFDRGEQDRLHGMAEAQGGIVSTELDSTVNYLILPDLGQGKTVQKKMTSLNAKGASIQILDRADFLKLATPTTDQVLAIIRQGTDSAALLTKARAELSGAFYVRGGLPPAYTFTGESFDGLDLSNFKLAGIVFDQCSFKGCILSGTHFMSATGCDFSKARGESTFFITCTKNRFIEAQLKKVQLQDSIADSDFSSALLDEGRITAHYAHMRGMTTGKRVAPPGVAGVFANASLKGTSFHAISFKSADFDQANLTETQFANCVFESATFRKAIAPSVMFMECQLPGANFSNADLERASFAGSNLTDAKFDGADVNQINLLSAKVGNVDFAKAKNYSTTTLNTGPTGPASTELDSLCTTARRIKITLSIKTAKDNALHTVSIDSRGLHYGWALRLPQELMRRGHRHPQGATMSLAMKHLASIVPGGAVQFGTIEVSSSKSSKTGKELRDLVMNAVSEAFNQPLPAAEELAAAAKAFRETQKEQNAADKERREKAVKLAEKQKISAKRIIAKKIEKEVGKVTDIATFLKALELRADKSKIDKATKMLKAEKFQLFNDITDAHLNGVVKSQTDPDLVYACRIESNGHYACCTQNLNICGGLRGSICKHLLVLIIGLVKAGQLDPSNIDAWIAKSHDVKPELDKEKMGEIFIRYKGAEAGEVDWRPTETVPEDYYAV